MLNRTARTLAAAVVFFGMALTLLGLWGSIRQFFSGLADILGPTAGLGIDGGSVTSSRKPIPQTGSGADDSGGAGGSTDASLRAPALNTPTPFQPMASTATQKPPGSWLGAETQPPQPTLPAPTRTPRPPGPPDRIVIDAIGLDAPVVISPRLEMHVGEDVFEHWDAPGYFAAGWAEGSAMLGETGNTVLSGHHNIDGMVFARLVDLQQGDRVTVYSGELAYPYVVAQTMKFEERYAPLAQRIENGRWLAPSDDERLTLVTCWPPDSNTYRLIVVAVPAD